MGYQNGYHSVEDKSLMLSDVLRKVLLSCKPETLTIAAESEEQAFDGLIFCRCLSLFGEAK